MGRHPKSNGTRDILAGLMHVAKANKNAQETLATWTDLLVGVVTVVFACYSLGRWLL